jgi:hypothetical protein
VYNLLTGLDQALISQWYKEKFKITQTFLLLISPLYSRGEIAAAELISQIHAATQQPAFIN